MTWQLSDAKNRFSEVYERALAEGPQRITRRSKDAVVLVAERDFVRLTGGNPPMSFVDYLLSAPGRPGDESLEIERDDSPMREVDL